MSDNGGTMHITTERSRIYNCIPFAPGGMRYIIVVVDDNSRYGWMYFLANKSAGDAATSFGRFLADVRGSGTLTTVECVRSDDGGVLAGGSFTEL